MATSLDKTPAAVDMNRRFARLAVAWFGVDARRVEAALRLVEERNALGAEVHLLDALVDARILPEAQAQALRIGQAPTQIDPVVPYNAKQRMAATLPPDAGGDTADDQPTQMGPYRILRRLGVGGMGAVYLAFDPAGNRQVAVKVLAVDQAPKPNILRRFQLEGQHGAMLAHPNIVRSHDMGQDPESGLHYIVLDFVDGPSAHELLDRLAKLEIGDAVHIILDIARALEYAHKHQIIHRDIKPGNILLASSGLAKLSDLGLAKRQGDTHNLTHASQGIGTPYYMPYEQAMNAKMADERSDIYALGATLYHLVAGEVPFPGESALEVVEKKGLGDHPPARTFNADVPDVLEAILARMLRRDPDDRYQTISDVIVELERSHLAAAMPSYATLDSALQDPEMRRRLTSPIEATQADLRVKDALDAKARQTWLVRYRDQRGNLCKSKATAAEILKRLRAGTIPVDAEAARAAQEKFKPLAQCPEFQKAVAALRAAKAPLKRKSTATPARGLSWWWIAGAALGVFVTTLVIWALIAIARG